MIDRWTAFVADWCVRADGARIDAEEVAMAWRLWSLLAGEDPHEVNQLEVVRMVRGFPGFELGIDTHAHVDDDGEAYVSIQVVGLTLRPGIRCACHALGTRVHAS